MKTRFIKMLAVAGVSAGCSVGGNVAVADTITVTAGFWADNQDDLDNRWNVWRAK